MGLGKSTYAFLDESGNPSLEAIGSEGVTRFFVIGAVLVAEGGLQKARDAAKAVRDKFFNGGPLKSSNISISNAARRIAILNDLLSTVEAKFIVFAVDKTELQKDGPLRYQQTFRKYLASQLFNYLYTTLQNVVVVADHVGRDEYMDGVEKYVSRKFPSSLFRQFEMSHVTARSENLIQVADFIAGSFAQSADGIDAEESRRLIRQAMAIVQVLEFPKFAFSAPASLFPEADPEILRASVEKADEYIAKNVGIDGEIAVYRVKTVEFLRTQAVFFDPTTWFTAPEIIRMIRDPGQSLPRRRFNSEVIGPLRDQGQLVASCDDGFKLIASEGDLIRYLVQTSQQVGPNIARAIQLYHAVTIGSVDSRRLLKQIPQLRQLMAFLAGQRKGRKKPTA